MLFEAGLWAPLEEQRLLLAGVHGDRGRKGLLTEGGDRGPEEAENGSAHSLARGDEVVLWCYCVWGRS